MVVAVASFIRCVRAIFCCCVHKIEKTFVQMVKAEKKYIFVENAHTVFVPFGVICTGHEFIRTKDCNIHISSGFAKEIVRLQQMLELCAHIARPAPVNAFYYNIIFLFFTSLLGHSFHYFTVDSREILRCVFVCIFCLLSSAMWTELFYSLSFSLVLKHCRRIIYMSYVWYKKYMWFTANLLALEGAKSVSFSSVTLFSMYRSSGVWQVLRPWIK